ncbi:MAG TPA: universal stress protein, partial [Methanotrichaceae archaeon]|nr:universal stress protein [Methanotrichaceae archaeon]
GLTGDKLDEVVSGMWRAVKEEGDMATKHVEEMARKSGVSVEKRVIEGHPASEILRLAEETPMNVIVIGAIGKTGLTKFLLGSVAEKVVRNSKVPVLVVPIAPTK